MNRSQAARRVFLGDVANVRNLVKIGILSAIAVVLMFIEFPLPLFPAFLKIDVSDLPALIGGFALGPVAGIFIELMKNILHILLKGTSTGGVGELANFLIGIGFVVPASVIYLMNKTKKGALWGMLAGTVVMGIFGAFANYYIIIPLYQKIMPLDAIINMAAQANPGIVDVKTYVLYAVIPFNAIKSIIISALTLLLYKKVSGILHR